VTVKCSEQRLDDSQTKQVSASIDDSKSNQYWFFACLFTVLAASIPVSWASVGDFLGRKSFGAILGSMNLFYT